MTALRPEDALCRNWPDEEWISSRNPQLGEVCSWCPLRAPCARMILDVEDRKERPCGWHAGYYLPEVGGNARDRELRRESLAALRELVAAELGSVA